MDANLHDKKTTVGADTVTVTCDAKKIIGSAIAALAIVYSMWF